MFRLASILLLAPASGTQLRRLRDDVEAPGAPAVNLLYGMVSGGTPGGKNASAKDLEAWQQWRPCAKCKEYVRMGELHDGGYLMCKELLQGRAKAVYSYGINGFDGFSAAVSERLGGAVVEQYDCFNTNRPACPKEVASCNFKFHEECVSAKSEVKEGRRFSTLKEQMRSNGHLGGNAADMVLKMDVEGAEWSVLASEETKELLPRFSQVVMEFHGAQWLGGEKSKALHNLLEFFDVVHIHANNCCKPYSTEDGYVVPTHLEVTFVRKGLVERTACDASPIDTPLDHRNVMGHGPAPQIKLG